MGNTPSLTEYFLSTKAGYKPYKKHINKDNPLGMGGAIAEAYGALLEDMWSGKFNCVAPRQFKVGVSLCTGTCVACLVVLWQNCEFSLMRYKN